MSISILLNLDVHFYCRATAILGVDNRLEKIFITKLNRIAVGPLIAILGKIPHIAIRFAAAKGAVSGTLLGTLVNLAVEADDTHVNPVNACAVINPIR